MPQNKLTKSWFIVYERTVRKLWQSEMEFTQRNSKQKFCLKRKKKNRLQWVTEKQSWGVDDQMKMRNDGFALAKDDDGGTLVWSYFSEIYRDTF